MASAPKSKSSPAGRAGVRKYIAALPPDARKRMQQIRASSARAAPGAVEHFSYRMPGFRLEGETLVWYAAFKRHTSLFPITPALVRDAPARPFRVRDGEGDGPIPARPSRCRCALVKRLVKARVAGSAPAA